MAMFFLAHGALFRGGGGFKALEHFFHLGAPSLSVFVFFRRLDHPQWLTTVRHLNFRAAPRPIFDLGRVPKQRSEGDLFHVTDISG